MSDRDTGPGAELLAVGKILRPHGIRGALVVEPLSDWPEERFAPGARLLLEEKAGQCREVTIESGGLHKGRMLVTIEGVADRNEAETLKGKLFMLPASEAAELGEGEYWAHELVDMTVVDGQGAEMGNVEDVLCREAQDMLVVKAPDGREIDIPFVSEFIDEVDVDARRITVDLPEGMV